MCVKHGEKILNADRNLKMRLIICLITYYNYYSLLSKNIYCIMSFLLIRPI